MFSLYSHGILGVVFTETITVGRTRLKNKWRPRPDRMWRFTVRQHSHQHGASCLWHSNFFQKAVFARRYHAPQLAEELNSAQQNTSKNIPNMSDKLASRKPCWNLNQLLQTISINKTCVNARVLQNAHTRLAILCFVTAQPRLMLLSWLVGQYEDGSSE